MNGKKAKGILSAIIIMASLALAASACGAKNAAPEENASYQLKIYTTFYPLYDFTKKIVGDMADVENMIPAGVEPHDFEPSPRQMAALYSAKVFIFLGEPMDTWAKKAESQLAAKGVRVVEAGKGLIRDNDPHVWLDPVMAKEMSRRICKAVEDVDAKNKSYYEKNMLLLGKKFDELDERYKEGLSAVSRKDIVTSHSTLGYLSKRYGLNQISITGLSPQEEPSPRKMAELAQICREKGIKYIFFETLASPKLSETLAREVGAQTLVFNPVEGLTEEEIKAGEDYFSIMEKNLENLKEALQ
ncbi:MAG: metal ABC transporter substrate-binding protein [Tepidanaerobacteraceae bacterium]|nr:metal ABC transporter substrate-binding protein [Tepidanaerobacteraceae bacterium]